MFNKGSYVVTGNFGLCEITDITNMEIIKGKRRDYYVLSPVRLKGTTYYYPADLSDKLRNPISSDNVKRIIEEIPDIIFGFIKNKKIPDETFEKGIEMCVCPEFVRDIREQYALFTVNGAAKKAGSDRLSKAMRNAKNRIYEEFAFALGCEVASVENKLLKMLSRE